MNPRMILYFGGGKRIPYMKRSELESVAETFVEEYYPEAFKHNIPVDMDVVYERLGLKLELLQLNEDFDYEGIYGMCCFTHGLVSIYDEKEEFIEHEVEPGTVIIDPRSYTERNEGCFNNTKAHEAVHWVFHRGYFAQAADEEGFIACREKNPYSHPQGQWSKRDFAEWQANHLAPRILMPQTMFRVQAENYRRQITGNRTYDIVRIAEKTGSNYPYDWLVHLLAEQYCVSLQSVRLRLQDLGDPWYEKYGKHERPYGERIV